MLACIPRPVLALILVLPPCPAYERRLKAGGTIAADSIKDEVVWLKQTINSACGLYAILHAVCNLPRAIETGSSLYRLAKLERLECTRYLENSKEVEDAYARAAQSGTSNAPCAEDEVDHHYICFVKHSDHLYELDGDMDGPTDRGLLEGEETLTMTAVDIIKQYLDSQGDEAFGLLALIEE
ncbi:hypothetical protein AJ79_00236 [Helicocarpus griseus UAMH5409]|uniref:Ubiquitin carboxyl-terminal hydrolase n=1 Tax=Helicocarpus griseus UAMH5409 TaxID=1447875 RepID=A0A2B7YCR1_9EURO|nr:hypothetical protein AJ79_00236 [Helicocarpus griseus UAMH5409]